MKIELIREYLGLPIGHILYPDDKTGQRLINTGVAISSEPIAQIKAKLEPSARGRKKKIDPESQNIKNKAQ